MAKPVLIINGHDYAEYIEELSPSRNDMDAEGSGRDVQTGQMFRTRIASKLKFEVRMLRLTQAQMVQLSADIADVYFDATFINPSTGTAQTSSFYVSTVPFGAQRYDRDTGAPYYDGVSFSMTEV